MQARRAFVSVLYSGVDITDDIRKDLLGFTYTDNASGNADDINISLKDDKRKWINNWFPEKGDQIEATIRTQNWESVSEGEKALLCGRFFVDEPQYTGRPGVLSIGAISVPLNSNFSHTKRNRVWRNITLRAIAGDIAKRAGLLLQYIGSNNPRYSSIEQTESSDSAFLSDLCEQEGLAMKVTDSKIVLFDEREFEKRESVARIREWGNRVLSYQFKSSLTNTAYDGVNVKYYDAQLGRNIEFLYAPGGLSEEAKIYQFNTKVRDGDEARRLAQRKLRNLNKKEDTGSISLVGNMNLLGGTCVDLEGFGRFDGKYYIEKATHSVGTGYTTDIEVRKVLEGY